MNKTYSEKWSGFLSRNDASSISRIWIFVQNSRKRVKDYCDQISFFRLGDESIKFQCRYARSVVLNQEYSIDDSDSDTAFNPVVGVLGYSMSVTADLVGRNTHLSISHNHYLNQIAPT